MVLAVRRGGLAPARHLQGPSDSRVVKAEANHGPSPPRPMTLSYAHGRPYSRPRGGQQLPHMKPIVAP